MKILRRTILASFILTMSLNAITYVHAEEDPSMHVYEISILDKDPISTLKRDVIFDYACAHPEINFDNIDIENSLIDVTGFNRNSNSIQHVNINIQLCEVDSSNKQLGFSFTKTAALKIVQDSEPQLRLTAEEITLNNSEQWNPHAYIAYIFDDSGILPAIRVDDNVDINNDGTYEAIYTAVDQEGNKTTQTLTVNVTTHPEVIAAREEAERIDRVYETQLLPAIERGAISETQVRNILSNPEMQGNETGNAIVMAARRWVGNGIYVMGGTNPATGTDCSGFTQYIFAKFGIHLNRTAASQASNGYQVSSSEAKPGDLVVWTGHVGIYAGNGVIIDAMNPSMGIREHGLNYGWGGGSFMGFYRIPAVNN